MAIILTSCEPSSPVGLWNQFKDMLAEDLLHKHRRQSNNPEAPYNDEIYNQALCIIEDKVTLMGGQPLEVYGLPKPQHGSEERLAKEYFREVDYNQEELAAQVHDLQNNLTEDQREVFIAFLNMVQEHEYNDNNDAEKRILFSGCPRRQRKNIFD